MWNKIKIESKAKKQESIVISIFLKDKKVAFEREILNSSKSVRCM